MFDDKSKFETFVTLINKYRIDAHAKKITDEDYAILMIAFKWFNEAFEDIII